MILSLVACKASNGIQAITAVAASRAEMTTEAKEAEGGVYEGKAKGFGSIVV